MTRNRRADDFELFLTAPYEQMLIRRGDPLGFRSATDAYADLLAPGLTNRTYDARWISLLSWILVSVEDARRHLGIRDDESRIECQRAIYDWIKPLELMWIERAVRTIQDRKSLDRRQLPGRNAILNFVEKNVGEKRFGMSTDQYRRYRFVGPHGFYRSLIGRLENISVGGDSYRPGKLARRLARLVPANVTTVSRRRGPIPSPFDYWNKAWKGRHKRLRDTERWLPGRWNSIPNLFAEERSIIGAALFDGHGAQERRRIVAMAATASRAGTHPELVRDVVEGLHSRLNQVEINRLASVVSFTRLADAGVMAMNTIWKAVGSAENDPAVDISDLAANLEIRDAMDALTSCCVAWLRKIGANESKLLTPVHTLTAVMTQRADMRKKLDSLLLHHLEYGGGRRWFRVDGRRVFPDAPPIGNEATPYRFRLWSLGRLAWQTGITDGMPRALEAEVERGDEESGEKEL